MVLYNRYLHINKICVFVCVCVCVRERERERERAYCRMSLINEITKIVCVLLSKKSISRTEEPVAIDIKSSVMKSCANVVYCKFGNFREGFILRNFAYL